MDKINVFTYGSLKKGFGNHRLLTTSDLLGTHVTDPKYTMYSLGAFPAIVPGGSTHISGEVYSVTPEVFERLDMLEGYPHFYNRELIDTDHGPAWVYFIPEMERQAINPDVVESGIWEEPTL